MIEMEKDLLNLVVGGCADHEDEELVVAECDEKEEEELV